MGSGGEGGGDKSGGGAAGGGVKGGESPSTITRPPQRAGRRERAVSRASRGSESSDVAPLEAERAASPGG